jgi:hypothetical protein
VAFERFQTWSLMEREEETFFSPPSTFQPKRLFFNLIPIDFKVFFYHGFKPLFGAIHFFLLHL